MDRRTGDDDHQIVDQSEILDGPTLVVDRPPVANMRTHVTPGAVEQVDEIG
jgi:hypothetical protein